MKSNKTVNEEQVIYQLGSEDVQSVALQSIGRELSDFELNEVKSKLNDFNDWDFYVIEAISEVLKENDGDIWLKNSSLNEYWQFLGGRLNYEDIIMRICWLAFKEPELK